MKIFTRSLAAMALAAAVAACSTHPLVPSSALRASPSPAVPAVAASAHPVTGVDVYARTAYPLAVVTADGRRVMRYIARLHAGGAGLVWNLCDPGRRSDVVKACSGTLAVAGVEELTREAQADGLAVQYRPIIRLGAPSGWTAPHGTWEGFIKPASQQAWFGSLYRAERPYLRAAQRLGVSQFVVGTELHGINSSPWWPWFLAKVRGIYHGSVAVAQHQSNYLGGHLIRGASPGVDLYPDLGLRDDATQAQVTAAFESKLARVPASVLHATSLDEVGFASVHGAYDAPQLWSAPGPADYLMQKRYFTAVCETVAHYGMAGLWFYEADLTENPAQPWAFPAAFEGRAGARAIAACAGILHD